MCLPESFLSSFCLWHEGFRDPGSLSNLYENTFHMKACICSSILIILFSSDILEYCVLQQLTHSRQVRTQTNGLGCGCHTNNCAKWMREGKKVNIKAKVRARLWPPQLAPSMPGISCSKNCAMLQDCAYGLHVGSLYSMTGCSNWLH